jgi:hypothetical protein
MLFCFRFLLTDSAGVNGRTIAINVNALCEEEAHDIIFEAFGENINVLECNCTGPAFVVRR